MFGKKYFHVMLSPIVTFKGKPDAIGCVVLIEDVTESRVAEKSRDEFFSIASHELRTPLTAIRGNVALIQQYFEEKIADKRFKQMLADIHDSSIRLITIVEDFLDSSRLEQGRITFKKESVALIPLIESVIKEFTPSVDRRQLTVRLEKGADTVSVMGDVNRIKQIMINLMGNSLKHTEKGSITLSVTDGNGMSMIRITDTGEGISDDVQKKLFTKFQRLTKDYFREDATNGSGLGLYIARMLAEGMGGSIILEKSVVGQGSTFLLTLPKVS